MRFRLTQPHDQCTKKKNITSVILITIYASAPLMLQKIGLPQMFAKNYFGNLGPSCGTGGRTCPT